MSTKEKRNSPKYNQVLRTAEELFMRYGIRRVTVEEICRTANVSKMTFYKFFKNKGDLAHKIIISLYDEGQETFDRIMQQDIPFAEKMNQVIQFKLEYGKRFSKEFFQDIFGFSPEIRAIVMERSQQGIQQILEIFKQAQQRGEIRKDLNLKFVAYMLDNLLELREDPRMLALFPDTYELVREWMNYFFYGIMGKSDQDNAG
ncbi:MAG: TetR/AcrR family transcriptional regulator [FCB group bacterium]|nr:TetR/AcrR family transcriptional regulator [FCB group bacterium]